MKNILRCAACSSVAVVMLMLAAPSSGQIAGPIHLSITNGIKVLELPLLSGVEEFKVLRSTDPGRSFVLDSDGILDNYRWTEAGQRPFEFFKVEVTPKNPEEILNAHVLNRLGYGPTPDELARINSLGADAYIREQLAPEQIEETLEIDKIEPSEGWQYATLTATATSSTLYLYLQNAGDCYIDNLKLVSGTMPETGQNRIGNGDFENGLSGWRIASIVSNSVVSSEVKQSGNGALHLISSGRGSSSGSSISRTDLGLVTGQTYTLSYWHKAGTNRNSGLVVRLSGAEPGDGIYSTPGSAATRLAERTANLDDLTAWHTLHAVHSKKQLQEVLLQFFDNHFVTQHRKSMDYLDRYYENGEDNIQATNLEYRELQRSRRALQDPQVTFYDLLKISAESPAMIIYLDTVNSKGNGNNIANENYARELLELFTFGVDNGYDQHDITIMSQAWTGWTVKLVDATNEFDPFAPASVTVKPGTTNNPPEIGDHEGVWAFSYSQNNHYSGEKTIFPGKTVPGRFGPPYGGRNYELNLPRGGSTEINTNWQHVTMTGRATSSDLYIYLSAPGDCYIDDLKIVAGTRAGTGENLVPGGDFDTSLAGWTVASNHRSSAIDASVTQSGSGSLHLVATSGGSSRGSSISRTLALTEGATYTISYWFKPGTMNGDLVIRLSGSGINSSPNGMNGILDGYNVIRHLADQPFTQEYISVKLCRLFVHDDFAHGYDFTDPNLSPEGRLVRECMRAWEESMPKGQLRKVLEVIFNSALFRSQAGSMQKIKTPFEFTISAIRTLRAKAADGTYTADAAGTAIRNPLNRMGRMRLFDRDDPDGYPEAGAPWISAGTLAERLRFVQALLLPPSGGGGRNDASGASADPVKLLKDRLPASAWNDAGAVAEFFIGLIYPSEGKANAAEYRAIAVELLNTSDNGATASPFANLTNANSYDTRVRAMVAALMTFQRFQEQ